MFNTIKEFVKKKTFRDLNIVFIENIFSKGFNFILIILIARTLGPEQYGIFSFVTVSILFLNMFLNFGMENTAICFSGRYNNKSYEIFGAYFLFRTATLIILLLFILFYPTLTATLLSKSQIEKLLYIIFIGCVVESYQYVITTYLQFQEKFFLRAVINAGVYLIRLLSILILLRLSISDVRIISLFFALGGVPFVLAFAKYFVVFLKKFTSNGIGGNLFKEILHYAKWIIFAAVATQIMTRLDFYVVTALLSFREAGLYNSALQLVFPLAILQMVFSQVFFPKVSKYTNIKQIKDYISRIALLGFIVLIIVILSLPFCRSIVLLLFGNDYLASSGVFKLLLISSLFTFVNVMLSLVLYALGYSRYMAVGSYIHLGIFILFVFSFIQKWGMMGVAASKLIADIGYLVFVCVYLGKIIFKLESKSAALT